MSILPISQIIFPSLTNSMLLQVYEEVLWIGACIKVELGSIYPFIYIYIYIYIYTHIHTHDTLIKISKIFLRN